MSKGSIYIVTAASGTGKTTLVSRLLAADPHIRLSISTTTRAPREGEQNGVHYHFVSRDEFMRQLDAGEFLESAEIYGNLYGTSQRWIEQQLAQGQDILLEIDWQGAQQVRRIFPDMVGIFILPPSLEVLRERLLGRGKDSPESIEKRLAAAREEIGHVEEADYVVLNQELDTALGDLLSIVRAQRLRSVVQLDRHTEMITRLKS